MRLRIAALCVLLACGKRAAPPPPPPAFEATPKAEPKLVDLLHWTPAIVALSSKVDNPKDFPEHIVDGKPETAWNGRTGDLKGGWIAFRVPPEAKVKSVHLTAGFDRNEKLWTENVRITRLRVTRDGTFVKEATLDPNRRGMQAIEIEGPGGDYKMEVVDVAPGSRADYKELCVSELVVLGIPASEVFDRPHMPHVFVGAMTENVAPPPRPGVPAFAPPPGDGPYATPEDFCIAMKKHAARPLFDAYGSGERYPGVVEPMCTIAKITELETKPALVAPVLDVIAYHAHGPVRGIDGILLKTSRGWWKTSWVLDEWDYADPGCMHSSSQKRRELASRPDGTVWMRLLDVESAWLQMDQAQSSWTTWLDRLEVCHVDATTGDLRCDATREVAKARDGVGGPDTALRPPPFAFAPTSSVLP